MIWKHTRIRIYIYGEHISLGYIPNWRSLAVERNNLQSGHVLVHSRPRNGLGRVACLIVKIWKDNNYCKSKWLQPLPTRTTKQHKLNIVQMCVPMSYTVQVHHAVGRPVTNTAFTHWSISRSLYTSASGFFWCYPWTGACYTRAKEVSAATALSSNVARFQRWPVSKKLPQLLLKMT